MSSSERNINNVLPVEMIQKILHFTITTSFSNLLQIRLTCRLWNELIFNECYLNRYFLAKQRRSLLYNLKLKEDDNLDGLLSKSNVKSTIGESPMDNGRLKCVIVESSETKIKDKIDTTQSDEYTVGFWLNIISKPTSEYADDCICLFGVKRDVKTGGNFIYAPSVGLSYHKDLTNNSGLYICGKCSFISYFKPTFALQQNQWYYICLVQTRDNKEYQHQISVNGRHIDERRGLYANPANANTELIFGLSRNKWKLEIADINVWNEALTKFEIQAIYTQCVSASNVKVGQYLVNVYLKEKYILASISPSISSEESASTQTATNNGES